MKFRHSLCAREKSCPVWRVVGIGRQKLDRLRSGFRSFDAIKADEISTVAQTKIVN